MSAEPPLSTCSDPYWQLLRQRLLGRLEEDMKKGLVDSEIVEVLQALNSCRYYVTSSSCSGRIAVFAAPDPGDKRRGGIVASWHRPVKPEELLTALREALGRAESGWYVWVSAQPLILALYSCSLRAVDRAARMLSAVGLKYTGYRFSSRHRAYYLFTHGTERIDVLVAAAGTQVIGLDRVAAIVPLLNSYLLRAKRRLPSLVNTAKELSLGCGDLE